MNTITTIGSASILPHPVPNGAKEAAARAAPPTPYTWPNLEQVGLESTLLGTPVDPAEELRLDDLRLRIAAGRYDTADKLDVVVEGVLGELKQTG